MSPKVILGLPPLSYKKIFPALTMLLTCCPDTLVFLISWHRVRNTVRRGIISFLLRMTRKQIDVGKHTGSSLKRSNTGQLHVKAPCAATITCRPLTICHCCNQYQVAHGWVGSDWDLERIAGLSCCTAQQSPFHNRPCGTKATISQTFMDYKIQDPDFQ